MTAAVPVLAVVVVALAALRGTWSPCGLSMLSAVNPVAERGRGHRFGATVAWFVTGAVLGGLVLGGAGALLAAVVDLAGVSTAVRLGVVAAGGLAALAVDRGLVAPLRLPLVPRQVDETWLTAYRRWIYAAGYGFQLGLGVATYVMTAAVGLVVVLGAVAGPVAALALGGFFGLVRGLALLVAAPVRGPEALGRLLGRIELGDARSLLVVDALVGALAVLAGWVVHPGLGAATVVVLAAFALVELRGRRPAATRARAAAQPKARATPGV